MYYTDTTRNTYQVPVPGIYSKQQFSAGNPIALLHEKGDAVKIERRPTSPNTCRLCARSLWTLLRPLAGDDGSMDAHYFTFRRKSAAITATLMWTSVSVATGYRGNLRVSTARATAHCASTANATVVATARAVVLSVENSVVPTMATHGSPRKLPLQFRRRKTTAISTAFRGHPW